MKIAIGAEADTSEPRVAATPDTVKKMIALGAEVAVQPGAGVKSGILDADYTAAGATVSADAVNGADIVLQVRRPAAERNRAKAGAAPVAGFLEQGLRARASIGRLTSRGTLPATSSSPTATTTRAS